MSGALKKHDRIIRQGMCLLGKWHQNSYAIKGKLGAGAIGTVYLCESRGKHYALKVSDQNSAMTMEVNVLKSLEKVQDQQLGPYLLDVDDWECPSGDTYTFYVMEYVQGEKLERFIRTNGTEWIGVFLLQLLGDLDKLHKAGWMFGDLKLDNLLIAKAPARLRWIDVGGVTQLGRSIKEYTEFNDRGYWGLGTRKAEPSYDLFAVVMVFLNLFYPKRFPKGQDNERLICSKIDLVKVFAPYRHCFKKAIQGKYRSSEDMRKEVAASLQKQRSRKSRRSQAPHRQKSGSPMLLAEGGGILLIAAGYYALSLLLP